MKKKKGKKILLKTKMKLTINFHVTQYDRYY